MTNVSVPSRKQLEGFVVVTFYARNAQNCRRFRALAGGGTPHEYHCLFPYLEEAETNLANGTFNDSEPGPYRIFPVYFVDWL